MSSGGTGSGCSAGRADTHDKADTASPTPRTKAAAPPPDRHPPPPTAGQSTRLTAFGQVHTVHMNPSWNDLDPLHAHILEPIRNFAPNLVNNAARDANRSCIGEALKPGSNVDAVSIDLAAINHHVTEIDAYPEIHAPVFGQGAIAFGQLRLDLASALNGLDRAAKLGQHAVASRVHY